MGARSLAAEALLRMFEQAPNVGAVVRQIDGVQIRGQPEELVFVALDRRSDLVARRGARIRHGCFTLGAGARDGAAGADAAGVAAEPDSGNPLSFQNRMPSSSTAVRG